MAASLAIRMAAGLSIFILMARGLGPHQYGFVATVFAYALLVSLVTDFGFTAMSLRDIAADTTRGARILSSSLSVKSFLCVLVILPGTLLIAVLPIDAELRISAVLFGCGLVVSSVGDLALTAYRSLSKFQSELWLTIRSSVVSICLIAPVTLLHGRTVWVAAAYCAGRLLYVFWSVKEASRLFPGQRVYFDSLVGIRESLINAWPWAVDTGLGYLSNQIDVLFVASILGLSSAGLYQSGARFAQSAIGLSAVLFNTNVPILAAAAQFRAFSKQELRMVLEYCSWGGLFSILLYLGGPVIVGHVLGPQYGPVNALWPGMSAFVFASYLRGAAGASLTAFGSPSVRVLGQCVGLGIVGGWLAFCPNISLPGVAWLMACGALVTAVVYWVGRIWIICSEADCPKTPSVP